MSSNDEQGTAAACWRTSGYKAGEVRSQRDDSAKPGGESGLRSLIFERRKMRKTYNREVLSVTRSPRNKLIWFLELKCGHAKWITRKSRPQGKAYPCQMCHDIDKGLTGD